MSIGSAWRARRVFAMKGSPETGKPLVGPPRSNNAFRTRLYVVCADKGKETVYARLRIAAPRAGYLHLPAEIDRAYVDQLTADKIIRKFVKGRAPQRQWVKTRDRNEALDPEVYSLEALRIALGPQPARAPPAGGKAIGERRRSLRRPAPRVRRRPRRLLQLPMSPRRSPQPSPGGRCRRGCDADGPKDGGIRPY
jgi:phage terminase large subunit GpA-like protein